jgi:hypothetical protein
MLNFPNFGIRPLFPAVFGGLGLGTCRVQVVALRAGNRRGTAIRSSLLKGPGTGFLPTRILSLNYDGVFRRSVQEWKSD